MKKKNIFILITCVFSLLLLASCAPENSEISESANQVNDASMQSAKLENGRFIYTDSIAGRQEHVEGIFLKQGDKTDWYTRTTYLDEKNPVIPSTTEFLKKGDQYYRRFLDIEEGDSFLEDNQALQAGAWHEVSKDTYGLRPVEEYLTLLQDAAIDARNIETVEITLEEEVAHHHFIYNQKYLGRQRFLNLLLLRVQQVTAKLTEPENLEAVMYEQMAESMENRKYKQLEVTWTISPDGFLTQAFQKSTIQQTEEGEIITYPGEIEVKLLEYNNPEIESVFPSRPIP